MLTKHLTPSKRRQVQTTVDIPTVQLLVTKLQDISSKLFLSSSSTLSVSLIAITDPYNKLKTLLQQLTEKEPEPKSNNSSNKIVNFTPISFSSSIASFNDISSKTSILSDITAPNVPTLLKQNCSLNTVTVKLKDIIESLNDEYHALQLRPFNWIKYRNRYNEFVHPDYITASSSDIDFDNYNSGIEISDDDSINETTRYTPLINHLNVYHHFSPPIDILTDETDCQVNKESSPELDIEQIFDSVTNNNNNHHDNTISNDKSSTLVKFVDEILDTKKKITIKILTMQFLSMTQIITPTNC